MTQVTPLKMLQSYRDNASPFMREQAKLFRAMSASDQREFLFYTTANMAVSQAASRILDDAERPTQQ
jgi:hypothetical protein